MTNALAVYERMNELSTAATALYASGFFGDVKTQAQAMVKVMAGAEIGLPPFASMSGIHIVQGKPVIGANLIATLVKNDPRYDYRVKRSDNEACVLTWYEGGKAVGESTFTMTEANAAGLTGKPTWKAYPSDMLFARALTRGARRYAPGIFGGAPVYTPDEMGVDTDEDGHIIEGQVVSVEPPPPPAPARPAANGKPPTAPPVQPAADPGPLAVDELTINEAPAAQFFAMAASLLETDEVTVKIRFAALGYTIVPGNSYKRVDAYRALKRDMVPAPTAAQDDLFGDDTAREAALATAQGRND